MIDFFNKLYKVTEKEFFSEMKSNLSRNNKMFIVTANPEAFMYGGNDIEVKKLLLDEKTTVVADGIGLVKAAKMLDIQIPERIPGIDIAQQLLEYGNEMEKSVYLFGAKQEVIEAMVDRINKEYPNLIAAGYTNGYVKDKDKVFETIKESGADIVLVALGMPAQEKLIYSHLEEFEKGIFVGVGGSFDVLSGIKKRAPEFFIKHNLEWLYRITKEPSRLKRFYDNNIKFLFNVSKEKKCLK